MSTILSVHAAPSWTAARDEDAPYVRVTRRVYSIDGYSPVLVTIRVHETFATVKSVSVPDGRMAWWREPTAAQRRMLVDHELFKSGMIRNGRVEDTTADAWFHRYPVRRLNTPSPYCTDPKPHGEHVFTHIGRMDDPAFGARIDCAGR